MRSPAFLLSSRTAWLGAETTVRNGTETQRNTRQAVNRDLNLTEERQEQTEISIGK